jgi:hypothetical protein
MKLQPFISYLLRCKANSGFRPFGASNFNKMSIRRHLARIRRENIHMVKRAQIVELASGDERQSGVLVTLVRIDGPSYRKPGARLPAADGECAGTISGGC